MLLILTLADSFRSRRSRAASVAFCAVSWSRTEHPQVVCASYISLLAAWIIGKKGCKDLYERVVEMYKEIQKELKLQALPEAVRREMDRIMKRADDHPVDKLGNG